MRVEGDGHVLVRRDRATHDAAWGYPDPESEYREIKDYFAFFAAKMTACHVGDKRVISQPSQYYGGWVTSNVVGPFKGEPVS